MHNEKEGIILVDKPIGITSHDVVDHVRKKLKMRRIGHAGTLDPLASGLLVILVGKATKLFSKFVDFDKEYTGILKLGEITTTCDSQGEVIEKKDYSAIDEEKLKEAFSHFEGEIDQVPPMVSALRVAGRRLYNLARKGIVVERKPRRINIFSLDIEKIDLPFVEFRTHCSKGTYIRKLAEDIGQDLGCGAHITGINRLKVGPFSLDDAVGLQELDETHIRKAAL